MIIKRLKLRNFQIHRTLDLELGEFSAIIGPSSAGKTSILRALDWLFYGNYDQTYPNNPEQETSVAIQLASGTVIARSRLGDKNRAAIRKPGEDAVLFEDFGAVIPGLSELINVREIQAGTKSVNLNFSNQDDPVFMVNSTWSGPAKAAWLGRLYGAHIITAMLRLMSGDKRDHESDRKRFDTDVEALMLRLAAYGDTKAAAEAVAQSRTYLDKMTKMVALTDEMASIMEKKHYIRQYMVLMSVDLDDLNNDALLLQDLHKAAQDRSEDVLDAQQAQERSGLLRLNLGALRADAERLAALRPVADEVRALGDRSNEFDTRLAQLKLIDFQTIKTDVAKHSELYDLNGDNQDNEKDWKLKKICLAKLNPGLDTLKIAVKKACLADGKCPVCKADASGVSTKDLLSNLKTVIGA